MTASRSRRSGLVLLAAGLLGLTACTTPAGAPPQSAFLPAVSSAPPPPDVADQAAVELARAALVSDREHTARLLQRFQAMESVLRASDEQPTGLLPVAIDLRNTTLDDDLAYRSATRELLRRKDLDPALRARLELDRDDDPLLLADARIRDAWLLAFGRAFNTLAEPIGKSVMTLQLAPYRLGQALLKYAAEVYTQESMNLQRRQALAHWKEYLARNPDTLDAEEIAPRMRAANSRFLMLQRDRALRVARKALETDRTRLALVYADRALRFVPEDREASELREEAGERLLALRELQRGSVGAGPGDPVGGAPEASRALAVALLVPGSDAGAAARQLAGADADEVLYVDALLAGEAGDDARMWKILHELADRDPERSNMARHAAALVSNPDQNTLETFRQARTTDRWNRARWVLLGPFFRGMPDRGLPGPLEWVLDAPSLAESLFATPMRLINLPWASQLPSAQVAAVAARRHLERHPEGRGSDEVRDWLLAYERKRENWIGALELVEQQPEPDLAEQALLREKAAHQYLAAAARQRSLPLRVGMYQQLGSIYPGSHAAVVAGNLARRELEDTTLQNIQLSRGFLGEHPELAGPHGLALSPALLDGDSTNAELHPEGVTLVGSRVVQVSYLAPSGDEDDPPVRRNEEISPEHLARVVSLIEEESYERMLVDPLESVGPDPRRDTYFERVRLGLAQETDKRPGAISSYAYRGVRERYGMVRARESILPFDVVFQASLSGLSLGAFPRIRPPRETPDAILYR